MTQDAQGIAQGEQVIVRERVVRRGHGKTVKEQRLRTELVGIEALTSYDQYGDIADTQNAHRSEYVGQPINAVVVRKWENRAPKEGGTVYLTNGEVRDPFLVFDMYDWRSVIENGIFHLAEFAVLTHIPIRILPSSLASPQAVLQRFGISP